MTHMLHKLLVKNALQFYSGNMQGMYLQCSLDVTVLLQRIKYGKISSISDYDHGPVDLTFIL